MELYDRERECTADELEELDIGRRVMFSRLRSDSSARPLVRGILRAVRRVDYFVGNMPRHGVEVTVAFPGRYGENLESHGPLPLKHPFRVGRIVPPRPDPWDDYPPSTRPRRRPNQPR
ncbi:hypothetical protein ACFUTX_06805 [Microbacterium sp. NPDC057407]|uniref:hypothetical protein n=1 Tax=Microbacterium sp. NPDC057407 TaxID=3346120 RepID=UPI00366B520F